MEALFLRVLAVSAAVSLLLLPLTVCRRWLERTYAPGTRWGLWLAVALALLLLPWAPKSRAPLVVEAPAYTVTLPALAGPKAPAAPGFQSGTPAGEKAQSPISDNAQTGPAAPARPGDRAETPAQTAPWPVAPATPEAAGEGRPGVSLTALASGLWLLGLAAVLLWQSGGYLLFRRRLLRSAQPVTGLERYALELDLAGVEFYESPRVSGPMTLGVLHPLVLLPEGEVVPAALRHELYHVKRRDVAYKILVLCACALHWFNPLVWRMYRWADRDVEACCDAAVVAGQDSGYRRSYGELLLSAAAEPRSLPFTTRFGGGKGQMRSRLTQLFRPGKRSRALVCAVLALAVVLGSLVACREEGKLADGVYCSPYVNVVYPVGDAEADGEDYGVMGLSLLKYDETEGPHGKPLGEYTLPLSQDLMLRQLWWEEDRSAGERGTQEWQRAVHELVHMPLFRDSIPLWADYLVVTVKGGEITRLSWALVDREEALEPVPGEAEAAVPLTENTMPKLLYYDPARDFLLYRTVDTAYFYYGDGLEEYRPDQSVGRRVLWRCDVSEDESTVYLSDVYDDREDREERFYAWDIAGRTLEPVDAIPPGVDHMQHVDPEELFYSGFMNGTSLKSNVIRARDGSMAGLYVDELIGNTIDYLRLSRMGPDGSYEGGEPFLTPERIPAPGTYTEPDWGFTLDLPGELAGHYVVSRAANNWNFYDKDLYSGGGYLFSLWAEDSAAQEETVKSYPGQWPGKILGEKDGITYTATFWSEDMTTPAERENEGYMTRMEAAKRIGAGDLDLSAVTRSSGYLWPLPYTQYGSDRLLGEEDNTLRILSSEGVTVQSVEGGRVVRVVTHPITGAQTVTVAHPDGRYSVYGHLEYIELGSEVEIKRGDIIGIAKEEDGLRWLDFSLRESGMSWEEISTASLPERVADVENARPIDPWSVEYRTYDFQPIDRNWVTVAGDPDVTQALEDAVLGRIPFYDREQELYCYAGALPQSDGVPVTVRCYTQLDLDGDTIPEAVLWLQRGEDPYLLGSMVLRYENGGVYGYPMGFRSMNLLTLKEDGTFSWSGGASDNGYGRLRFTNGRAEMETIEGREETVPDVTWNFTFSWGAEGVEKSVPAVEK